MAIAIDGEIYQDAYSAPLNPDSEIVADTEDRRRLANDLLARSAGEGGLQHRHSCDRLWHAHIRDMAGQA